MEDVGSFFDTEASVQKRKKPRKTIVTPVVEETVKPKSNTTSVKSGTTKEGATKKQAPKSKAKKAVSAKALPEKEQAPNSKTPLHKSSTPIEVPKSKAYMNLRR